MHDVGFWLQTAVRATDLKQPLHLQELTFKFELPLSRVWSAVPPGADSQDGGAVGPEVTQLGHHALLCSCVS